MIINMKDLFASLEIMGLGMAGLFGVCALIMLLIMLIAKLIGKPAKEKPKA